MTAFLVLSRNDGLVTLTGIYVHCSSVSVRHLLLLVTHAVDIQGAATFQGMLNSLLWILLLMFSLSQGWIEI